MPQIKLNDLNFYYEVEGEGFPLVLLAGLACDSNHWRLLKPFLIENFQVITIDNRSAGRTEVPANGYTIEEMGEDVMRLLDHLKISKAHFLGHSMGGAIAQTIAYRFPRYIERLIISHSFAKITPRGFFWMQHCAALYDAKKSPEVTLPVVAPWIFSNEFFKDPKKIEELLAIKKSYPYPQTARGFRQQMEAVAGFDATLWGHRIKLPTCIIAGKEDVLTPLEASQYLHQQIKNSQFILQEGAHAPMFDTISPK